MSRARIMVLSVPSCRLAAATRSELVLEASLRFRGMHRSPRTEWRLFLELAPGGYGERRCSCFRTRYRRNWISDFRAYRSALCPTVAPLGGPPLLRRPWSRERVGRNGGVAASAHARLQGTIERRRWHATKVCY